MTRYAAKTDVAPDRSRAEIEHTLIRYGCQGYAYGWDGTQNRAIISFEMKGKGYQIAVPLPDRASREFTHTPDRGKLRSPAAAQAAYEQACRQRWRVMLLQVKASLETAELGVVPFERLMQAFIMLPDGRTVGDWMAPQIEQAYVSGKMPALLPMLEHQG